MGANLSRLPVTRISTENMMRRQSLQRIEITSLYAIDNDDQSSEIVGHTLGSREKYCSVPRKIKEEVEVQDSLIDEFVDIQSIPETPQKSVGQKESPKLIRTDDGKNHDVQVRLPLKLERRPQKRRTESIRSNEELQRARSLPESRVVEDEEILQGSSSPRPSSRPREAPIVTKLRPLPRGAPRTIERKGRYTIRKGVRIRDYRLPGPHPWPRVPLSSSPEYQCRDGFNEKEASLGYPQPMIVQKRSMDYRELDWEHGRPHRPRRPSMGALQSA